MTDRLLWHSNAPHAPTGYGQQTALFCPELARHYELAISCNYGLEGAPLNWKGIPMLPGASGDPGNQTLLAHAKAHFGEPKDGLVVTLYDSWVFHPEMMQQLNAAAWVPVDHEPAPPRVKQFFEESGVVPLAMSRFATEELAEFGAIYVPHAVDLDVYKPQDREVSRAQIGIPEDAFVVGMVAANKGAPSRKGFSQAFEAFRAFRQKHDDAHLYLHTVIAPGWAQGEDIAGLLAALEIPESAVTFSNQYRMMSMPMSQPEMARLYSSFDVLLNPAWGEGFGIPIVEAQACGVPVIASDFTAMRETCGVGWKVPVRPLWTGHRSWQGIPEIEEIYKALVECHGLSASKRAVLAKNARDHARTYALPRVLDEFMLPALRTVAERIAPSVEVEAA